MTRVVVAVAAAALLAAPLAAGAGPAKLSPQDRQAIGVLVDRFVKDAVRREDLPAAWKLLGPGLSGGTTRKAWANGTGVTVEYYPVRGTDFRTAWTADVVAPGDVDLAFMFHADAKHPKMPQTAFKAEVVKRDGRWVVNGFYPAATFFGGGHVEGPADFGPGAAAAAVQGPGSSSGARWLAIFGAAVGALVVGVPLAIWLRMKRRDRRAYAAYLGTKPRVSR